MNAKQRSISYRNGTPGYFTSRGVWKEIGDQQPMPGPWEGTAGSLNRMNRAELTDFALAMRAENQRLREALQRLQDICVSPTYRQACFADATEQARAALKGTE